MNPMTNIKNVQRMNNLELERGWNPKTSWHNQYKDSAWIFIGGLPYDLTEGDMLAVFSQYGEIVNVNLVRDKTTGKQKGFGFICYEDQRSTILAVDNFNSIKLLGRTLRVDHVQNYKAPEDKEGDDELTLQLKAQGCGPDAQPLVPKKTEEEEEEDDGLLPLDPSDTIDKKKKKLKKEKKEKKKKKKKKRRDSSSEGGSPEPVKIKQEPASPPPRGAYKTKLVAVKQEPLSPNPRKTESQRDQFDDRSDRRRWSRSRERDFDRNRGEGSRHRSRSRSPDRSRSRREDGMEDRERRDDRGRRDMGRGDRRNWSRDKRDGERERGRERQMDDRRGRDRDRR